uniref:Uncharacterized protein n=1 Tax=Daucus carota subsp. sativus TaxID=79200 RepID=A0A175YEK3_DAUCS
MNTLTGSIPTTFGTIKFNIGKIIIKFKIISKAKCTDMPNFQRHFKFGDV